jgi:hypothetical protein
MSLKNHLQAVLAWLEEYEKRNAWQCPGREGPTPMRIATPLSKTLVILLVMLTCACAPCAAPPVPGQQATLDIALTQFSAQSTQLSRQEDLLRYLATSIPRRASPSPGLGATLDVALTQLSAHSTQIPRQEELLLYLATSVPRQTPAPPIRLAPTPFVSGALSIESGRCCVGGVAGQPLQIRVEFQAHSPLAEIADMRVRSGGRAFTEQEIAESEWQAFASIAEYTIVPPINWTGYYVSVQYRDALGNLSPVYSDDISVEGEPAPPTSPAS